MFAFARSRAKSLLSMFKLSSNCEGEGDILEEAKINDFQAKQKNQFLNSLKGGGLWLS